MALTLLDHETGSGTSLEIPHPGGLQVGDLLLAVGCARSTPGWVPSFTTVAYGLNAGTPVGRVAAEISYRIADAADIARGYTTYYGTSHYHSTTGTSGSRGELYFFTGQHESPFLDAAGQGSMGIPSLETLAGSYFVTGFTHYNNASPPEEMFSSDPSAWDTDTLEMVWGLNLGGALSASCHFVLLDGDTGTGTTTDYSGTPGPFHASVGVVILGAEEDPPPDPPPPLVPEIRGGLQESPRGTPAHVLIGKSGEAAYPRVVGEFVARSRVSGGQIALTGRVADAFVRSNPECVEDGALWLVTTRETGDPLTAGEIVQPALNGGAVDLSASGAERHALRDTSHLFWAEFGFDVWVQDEAEPHKRGRRPGKGPGLELSGAGNVNVGVHGYKLTHVSAEGETRAGPAEEIDVTGGAKEVDLTLPEAPRWATQVGIYRTDADGSSYGLVDFVDATDTTYTDNTADGSLGAAPPTSWRAEEIGVDVKEGLIEFTVERGATVFDGQSKGVMQSLLGAEYFSGIELEIDPTRDAAGWQLRVEAAEDTDSPLSLVDTFSVDADGPGDTFLDIPGNKQVLRIALKRTGGNVTDADPLRVKLHKANTYGRAKDSDYSVSDVVRDLCAEAGVSDRYVRESGISAMPFRMKAAQLAEGFDLMALYAGWIWRLFREGLEDVCYFGPPGRRRWVFEPRWGVTDLLPLRRYSRVELEHKWADGITTGSVFAVAEPNPLGRIVTAPPLQLDAPSGREFARTVAQRLADSMVQERRQGSLTAAKIRDEDGVLWGAHEVDEGDAVYVPSERAWVYISEMDKRDGGIIEAECSDLLVSILDTYNARLERRKGTG